MATAVRPISYARCSSGASCSFRHSSRSVNRLPSPHLAHLDVLPHQLITALTCPDASGRLLCAALKFADLPTVQRHSADTSDNLESIRHPELHDCPFVLVSRHQRLVSSATITNISKHFHVNKHRLPRTTLPATITNPILAFGYTGHHRNPCLVTASRLCRRSSPPTARSFTSCPLELLREGTSSSIPGSISRTDALTTRKLGSNNSRINTLRGTSVLAG